MQVAMAVAMYVVHIHDHTLVTDTYPTLYNTTTAPPVPESLVGQKVKKLIHHV